MRGVLVAVISFSALVAGAAAQEGAEPGNVPAQPTIPLSLDQAIVWALQNNLDIEISGYTPDLRASQVEEQRARFDPEFQGDFSAAQTAGPGTIALTGREVDRTETYGFGTQIRRQMPMGGTWQIRVEGRNQVTNSLAVAEDRTWFSTATLTVNQPLLRNFGFDFNRSTIHIAKNSLEQSYYDFERQVQDTVQQVVTAYWTLHLAADTLRIQLESLDRVRTSMELTRLLVQEGKLAKHEIFEVETNLSSQLESVHRAQKDFLDAEDELKRLIAPENVDFVWNSHIELVTRPTVAGATRPTDEIARTALEIRPEIHSLRLTLQNADEAILQARNQMLPRLDLTGSVQMADQVGHSNYANAVDAQWSGNFGDGWGWNWSVGVAFVVPIGNRGPRAVFTNRVIERRQAEASLRNTESQIVNQVREAARDVATTLERVDVTTRGAEAALKRYQSEEVLFREGQTDNFRLQQFRQNLLQAQLLEISARAQHAISHIDLERAEGTILRRLRDRNILIKGVENR